MSQDELLAWMPSASMANLRQRAELMASIRHFFNARGYLEVETPIMARFGVTDRYLNCIPAFFRGKSYALQTSPEYHMKRLLAAGSGPIYQLARSFRDDEIGRWHNPEFTMLEWYQVDIDHHALLAEVSDVLVHVLNCPPVLIKTYREAFEESCGINPFDASIDDFKYVLQRFDLQGVLPDDEVDRDQYLFLLMSHVVEPSFAVLIPPIAVIDFPSSQAALARIENGVASRFEVYYRGIELANGFHELTDACTQAARFEQDRMLRKEAGFTIPEPDSYLLAALEHGLPHCSGVALGVDRLLAFALDESQIASVLAFDFKRA